LITDKSVYELRPSDFECLRRQKLPDIKGATIGVNSDDLVLHHPRDNDAHYLNPKKREILSYLERAYEARVGKKLDVKEYVRFCWDRLLLSIFTYTCCVDAFSR